jgi:protein-serine/threonine kinase
MRDLLAESTSPWVVQLSNSFQDPLYLYLGDLMTMPMKYDMFSEDVTHFYTAECILATEAVHFIFAGMFYRSRVCRLVYTRTLTSKRLIEQQEKANKPARNSIPSNLTMTREQVVTWKANRNLLFTFKSSAIRLILLLAHLIPDVCVEVASTTFLQIAPEVPVRMH